MNKKSFFILIVLFLSYNFYGQNDLKKVDIDENYNLNEKSSDVFERHFFNLIDINTTNYKTYFRYKKDTQVIDVFSNDNINFKGRILNHLIEEKTINDKGYSTSKPVKYVYEIVELDDETANTIGKSILNSKIQDIPDYKEIENWNQFWLDCGAISFIIKIDSKITDKSYSCPWQQNDSIKYVSLLKSLYNSIDNNKGIKNIFEEFKNKLEKGKSYSNGFISMYLFTKEESKIWNVNKYKREYLESIKDTISKFLEIKVNETLKKPNELNCFDDYQLFFSAKGKLINVKIHGKLDKDERKCIRLIKKSFKNIKVNFIDPKYPFKRILSFYNNYKSIYDDTIY